MKVPRGWVCLPPTTAQPTVRMHRIKPENPNLTWCGRRVRPFTADPSLRQCRLCLDNYTDHQQKPPKPAGRNPRGGSVKTVSGGLPGLGKR